MDLLSKLKESEPVRLYLYPLIVVLIGYAVTRGIIDQSLADMVVPIIAALLGAGATEVARAKVTPVVGRHRAS